eukprot:781094-Pelagomonas_calceolata.AAC.4
MLPSGYSNPNSIKSCHAATHMRLPSGYSNLKHQLMPYLEDGCKLYRCPPAGRRKHIPVRIKVYAHERQRGFAAAAPRGPGTPGEQGGVADAGATSAAAAAAAAGPTAPVAGA